LKNIFELRSRFLNEIAEQAPQIVHDLFERNDSTAWADRWGFLSEWIIEKAEWALECRSGKRDQAHALRLEWTINHTRNQARALLWLAVITQTQDPRLQVMITQSGALRLQEAINELEELRAWRQAAERFFYTLKPEPLTIDVFDGGETFRYLSEEELFERLRSDPRIRRTIAEYHRAVFHDHPYFGCFRELKGIRSSQEEKHMSWLIAYIAGAFDPDIARSEGIDDENTIRMGRERFARRIERTKQRNAESGQ
jgi:hypothetical protein